MPSKIPFDGISPSTNERQAFRSSINDGRALALAAVLVAADDRNLAIRPADHGIESAGIERDDGLVRKGIGTAPRGASSSGRRIQRRKPAPHQPPRPPGLYIFQLLGKATRIAGRFPGFLAKNCRCLVVAMSVAGRAAEREDDHVGLLLPDHPDDVRQSAVAPPTCPGFPAPRW